MVNSSIFGIQIIYKDKKDINKLKSALRYLCLKDEKSFNFVRANLRFVAVVRLKTKYNEALVRDFGWLVSLGLLKDGSYPYQYIASLLIHEACHIKQYKSGKKYLGSVAETEAYKKQRSFLNRIGYKNAVRWLDEQYKNRWWVDPSRDNTHKRLKKFILDVKKLIKK